MKKTLSMLAVLGIIAVGAQATQAAWYDSNWNPSNWFGKGCNKCEKKCDPCKKVKKCDLLLIKLNKGEIEAEVKTDEKR